MLRADAVGRNYCQETMQPVGQLRRSLAHAAADQDCSRSSRTWTARPVGRDGPKRKAKNTGLRHTTLNIIHRAPPANGLDRPDVKRGRGRVVNHLHQIDGAERVVDLQILATQRTVEDARVICTNCERRPPRSVKAAPEARVVL